MNKRNTQTEALFEIWTVFKRFRWRFIGPAFLAAVVILGGSLLLPRKYKGEAVFERRTDMVLSEIVNHGAPRSYQDPKQSLINEIVGETALDDLFEQLGPQLAASLPDAADRTELRNHLKHKVTVSYDMATNELDRIRVGYIGEDAEMSRAVVNTLVRQFIERTRGQIEHRLRQSSGFFSAEAAKARKLIEELENRQLVFEIDHAQLLPDNPNSVQTTLGDAQHALSEAEQRYQTARSRVDGLAAALETTPKSIPSVVSTRNPKLDQLETTLRELEARLAEAVGVFKMKPKHPDVIVLTQQIAAVREQIASTEKEVVKETRQSPNPKHDELELLLTQAQAELEAATRQVRTLTARVTGLSGQADNLFAVRSDYRKLSRRIEDSQRQLAFWENNQRMIEMALTAESGDRGVKLALIKACDPITKPVSPNIVQVLLATLLVSVVVGGISVFYAYRTDETFSDADKLTEAFDMPTLGSVSEIISRTQRRLRRLRNLVVYPLNGAAMGVVLVLLTCLLYLNLEKPHLLDEFRSNPVEFLRSRMTGDKAAPTPTDAAATEPGGPTAMTEPNDPDAN